MKLALVTDEVSQDLGTVIKLAVRYQLDGVELRTVWNKPVQHLSRVEIDSIRKALGEHGLAVAAIASPAFKCELDDDAAYRDHLQSVRDYVRIAVALDARVVRVFSFWKRGPSRFVWERVRNRLRPLVPIAAEAGVILAIENEPSTYCATAAETARMVAELDSPAVRVAWSPCNELFAAEGVAPYPDACRHVEGALAHVHVKDAKQLAKGLVRMARLGEGSIDWLGHLADLLDHGYQGYASLETHWRPPIPPEDLLGDDGGRGFPEPGEYATDLCLRNLLSLLAAARRSAAA